MIRSLFVVAAILTALPSVAADLCLVPSSNGLNVTADCLAGAVPTDAVGYSADSFPCQVGSGLNVCFVDSPTPPDFAWTISSSAVDALQNTGAIGPDATDLYLWLFCTAGGGMSASEFALGGDLEVISFTPVNGALNAGTDTELRLAIGGCPQGPIPVGIITVQPQAAVGVDGIRTAAGWGHVKAGYR